MTKTQVVWLKPTATLERRHDTVRTPCEVVALDPEGNWATVELADKSRRAVPITQLFVGGGQS